MKNVEDLKKEKRDYLDHYSFNILTENGYIFKIYRGYEKIIYENEYAELEFSYEINQYNIMLHTYIAISPKSSSIRYNVIDILNQQNIENLDDLIREYKKGKETGEFQTTDIALLLIIDKHLGEILNGKNTDWEVDVKETLLA